MERIRFCQCISCNNVDSSQFFIQCCILGRYSEKLQQHFFLHLGFTAEQSHLVTYPQKQKPADLHETAAPLVSVRLRYPIMLCARKSSAIPFSRLPLCSLSLINSAARNKQEVAFKKQNGRGGENVGGGTAERPRPLTSHPANPETFPHRRRSCCLLLRHLLSWIQSQRPPPFPFPAVWKKKRDTHTTRTRHTHDTHTFL